MYINLNQNSIIFGERELDLWQHKCVRQDSLTVLH